MKTTELYGHIYVTDQNFKFELEDDQRRQFGVLFEALDMFGCCGEGPESHPYILTSGIYAHKIHQDFDETEDGSSKGLDLLLDCKGYIGGVPVDLIEPINNGSDEILEVFQEDEVVRDENGDLRFKTEQDVLKVVEFIIKTRIGCLGMMIGFILDRPLNMIGNTGWDIVKNNLYGHRYDLFKGTFKYSKGGQ